MTPVSNMQIFSVNYNSIFIVLIINSTAAVVATVSLVLETKFLSEMKTKVKRENNSKSKIKQTKTKISKKTP